MRSNEEETFRWGILIILLVFIGMLVFTGTIFLLRYISIHIDAHIQRVETEAQVGREILLRSIERKDDAIPKD